MNILSKHKNRRRLEKFLRGPQFRQALFEAQTAACERLWAEMRQDKFIPVTAHCHANREFCNECDYLLYCTNHKALRGKCLEENGACTISDRPERKI